MQEPREIGYKIQKENNMAEVGVRLCPRLSHPPRSVKPDSPSSGMASEISTDGLRE